MSKLSQVAMGFGPVRACAGEVTTLDAINGVKLAVLELRAEIQKLNPAVQWQTECIVRTIDEAIDYMLWRESQIAPEILAEMNNDA